MADQGSRAPATAPDTTTDEQKMRRALGLHGGPAQGQSGAQGRGQQPRTPQQRPEQARARHRFVQDGGVPVVVVNHRTDEIGTLKERIGELERLLETERAQHANTRRTLQEAQANAQALETRLVHADLAHQDALTQERRAAAAAREALAELQAQVPTAPARRARPEPEAAPTPVAVQEDAPPPKKRGRPRTRPLPEPKPVRWWTPSFRAKTKA